MDKNLPRWIFASLGDHFQTVADGISLRFFIEGVDEEEAADFQNDSALFRMDGPVAFQGSSIDQWYKVEIQILLTDLVALTNDNAYEIYEWAGEFQSDMLNNALQIFKYGDGPDDDQSLVGCLYPDTSVRNNVRVVSYGMVDENSRVKQVSVNGKFTLCL